MSLFDNIAAALKDAIAYANGDTSRGRIVSGDMTGNVVGRNNVGQVVINGKTYSGNNLSMSNGRIIIDGVDVTDDSGVDLSTVLSIKVTGDIEHLTTDKSVSVTGQVKGNISAGGSVNCDNVQGDVKANGSVNADDIGGNVNAAGSVNCDDVGGSITAGGSVRRG